MSKLKNKSTPDWHYLLMLPIRLLAYWLFKEQ